MKLFKKIVWFLVSILMIVSTAEAWTTSRVRADKADSGEWRLHSMPPKTLHDTSFDEMNLQGILASITIIKDKGLWENPTYAGKAIGKENLLQEARVRLNSLKKSFDSILTDRELVVMTYWVDYGEIVVYFHTDRWNDKDFHARIAKELNSNMKSAG